MGLFAPLVTPHYCNPSVQFGIRFMLNPFLPPREYCKAPSCILQQNMQDLEA